MPKPAEVISHWHHSIEDFSASAVEFYRSVEATLKAKEAPAVSTEVVEWNESGILSAKRDYLRISYGRYSFDLCAAPFGRDFFFSWWLVKRQPDAALLIGCLGIMALPVLLLLLWQMAGFFMGILLFIVVLGGAGLWIVGQARRGVGAVEDTILAIPFVGSLYTRFFRPVTYYATDTRLIFEESVHRVVLQHVEVMRTANNLPALSPTQSRAESGQALK
jgi:hypothetical protein